MTQEDLMTTAPHDLTDLRLAPVVLALDARLEELGRLDPEALAFRVALEGSRPDRDLRNRETGALETVRHLLDCHGWELSWHPRGIRVAHDTHHLVLGVPANLTDYVAGATR
ncbi:hypothetical protein BH11ACT8_BH11ACT8_01330 [soil metagenome]